MLLNYINYYVLILKMLLNYTNYIIELNHKLKWLYFCLVKAGKYRHLYKEKAKLYVLLLHECKLKKHIRFYFYKNPTK